MQISTIENSDQRGSKYWKKFRTRLLINPKFQYSFMRYFVGIAAATLGVFYTAKVLFFNHVHTYLRSLGFSDNHVLYDFLTRQSHIMDALFAGAAAVEIAFLAWMALRISNRIAGPLYRLRKEMLRTAQGGALTHLKFRDGDYFEELADAYNEQMKHATTTATRHDRAA
jgi:sensor histidine kinase YesM